MNVKPNSNYRATHVATLSLLFVALIVACGKEVVEEAAEVARPIKMITIGAGTGGATLEIPGSVFAAQSAELAFEVPGRMMARMVEEGQIVKAGEVVARIDARDYVSKRDRAKANRDTAKADYDRYAKAYESFAVTEQQVSLSKGQMDVAQAELAVAAKALEDTSMRAPFDGRIAKRLVDDFANVRSKQPVMILQDESSLELRVAVAERDWVRTKSGASREELTKRINPRIEIASLRGRYFPAHLKEMSTTADPITRTYEVTFGFDSPSDANVSPGMTGRVVVDLAAQNDASALGPLSIPSGSIAADEAGNPFVWVVDSSSMRVHKQPVELGELSGDSAAILSGLSGGEQIVVSGVNSLSDNMLVRNMDRR